MDAKTAKFITLRADGLSFDKIASSLKIAKSTCIQWAKLHEDEIKDLQFASYLHIKESYSWNQKQKYEMLLKQLNKIDNGILEADLSNASIKDLFTVRNSLLVQIEGIERRISTDAKINFTDEYGIKSKLRLQLNEVE